MTTFGIIFFAVLIIIGAGIACYFMGVFDEWSNIDLKEKILMFLLGLLPSICVVFFIFLFFSLFGLITRGTIDGGQTSTYTEIKSIALKENVSGSFVLGCGTISGDDYYYFIKDTKYGYQTNKQLINDDVYIKEDGNDSPYIEYVQNKTIVTQTKFFNLFFKNKTDIYYYDAATIFHLPKGSIVQNYKVDINNIQ